MAILARNLSLLLAALMLASGWASAADRGQSIGSSNALQLYKNCVLRSLMTACTDLIEQAKTPGFSNVYSVAAAYYKRGTLKAEKDQLGAALADYKIASSLFPFPQLDLDVARLKKRMQTTEGRPSSATEKKNDLPAVVRNAVPDKKPAVDSNQVKQAEQQETTINSKDQDSSVATVRAPDPASKTRSAAQATATSRSPTLPRAKQAKPSISRAPKSARTNAINPRPPDTTQQRPSESRASQTAAAQTPKQKAALADASARPVASPSGVNPSDIDWETVTARIIHRHRIKGVDDGVRARERPAALRGTCLSVKGAHCSPTASGTATDTAVKQSIQDSEFSTATELETVPWPEQRVAGRSTAAITTGSLPSFQAMSGLRPRPGSRGNDASKPSPNLTQKDIASNRLSDPTGMTPSANSVKVSMISRSALVLREPASASKLAPSAWHYLVLLIVCSAATGVLYLRHSRAELRKSETASTTGVGETLQGRNLARSIVVAQALPEHRVVIEEHAAPTTPVITDVAPQQLADEPAHFEKSPIGQPGGLTDAFREALAGVRQSVAAQSIQANSIPKLRDKISNGDALVVALADDNRHHIIHATLTASLAEFSIATRPVTVLDSNGGLTARLEADEDLRHVLRVVDWHQPKFAGLLNPFSIGDLGDDPLAREQALNSAFETQCLVCECFLGSTQIARSRSQLRHLFRLMSLVPGADFATLRALLQERNARDYDDHIAALNSKSSRDFFSIEFPGKSFETIAAALIAGLDDVLADDTFAAAMLVPAARPEDGTSRFELCGALTVFAVPLDDVQPVAAAAIRRMCLARAMGGWPMHTNAQAGIDALLLVVDCLSAFDVPHLLSFSQLTRTFSGSGGQLIAGEGCINALPAGVLAHVAGRSTQRVVDSSSATRLEDFLPDLTTGLDGVGRPEWDGSDGEVLLLRRKHQSGFETIFCDR